MSLRKLLKHSRKRKRLFLIGFAIISSATFGQFIIEEALQNFGFGVMTLMMNKVHTRNIDKAHYVLRQIEHYETFHNATQGIMYILYIGNPISAIWFQQFMVSNREKIRYWKYTVKSELYYLLQKEAKKKWKNKQQ